MIAWRIYYDDGTTFDSADGPFAAAPGLGVQVVAVTDEDQSPYGVGRLLLHSHGFYWQDGSMIVGGDQFGLFDYLSRPGLKAVKFGRTVRHETFDKAMERAANDPDLPMKSAWRDGEQP